MAAAAASEAAIAANTQYRPQTMRQCINMRRTVAELYQLYDLADPAVVRALQIPPLKRPVGPMTFDADSRDFSRRMLQLAGPGVAPADDRSAIPALAKFSGIGQPSEVGWWAPLLEQYAVHYAEVQQRKKQRQPKAVKNKALDYALLHGAEENDPIARWLSAHVPRDEPHKLSNVIQEASLVAHAKYVAERMPVRPTCVVDFGAGNGILTYAIAEVLRCEAVCVDRKVPRVRVDTTVAAECPYFRRVHKPIEAVDWRRDIGHAPESTLVVTKHLCGSGVDAALRMCGEQGIFFGGVMATTCCHHKGQMHSYVNPAFLRYLGITTHEEFFAAACKAAWLQAERQVWQQRIGAALEAALDHGRVLWLREYGYAAEAVPYVHPIVTPRNTCLMAWPARRLAA